MPKSRPLESLTPELKAVHHGRYLYRRLFYKGRNRHVEGYCPEHKQSFTINVTRHLKGGPGCPDCAAQNKGGRPGRTLAKIIASFREIHGETYDYSQMDYQGADTKVPITCRKCGHTFAMTPRSHQYKKRGCPQCRGQGHTA